MKNTMTRVDALNIAISTIEDSTVVEVLTKIRDQIAKPHTTSDAVKEKRKAATAKARAEMVSQIIPILRDVITTDMTAKEIFAAAQDKLPADFTAGKVQNILLREMAPVLIKTEFKNKANMYRLAE